MELDDRPFTQETATPLVVADWKIDAEAVVTICRQRLAGASAVHVVVPAWLHGLDWAGDPFTSVPCARRQLDRISRLCLHAGLRVISADVGDPDPLNAISDALDHRAIDSSREAATSPAATRSASRIAPSGSPASRYTASPLRRARRRRAAADSRPGTASRMASRSRASRRRSARRVRDPRRAEQRTDR
jgi:hypothetical protein